MHLEENVPVRSGKLKVLSVILVGIFTFAVGGVGGYWVGSRQQQFSLTALQALPKPSWMPYASPVQDLSFTPTIAISQTDPTSDWKTYKNREFGFTFKYPPNTNLRTEQFANGGFRVDIPMGGKYYLNGGKTYLLNEEPNLVIIIEKQTTNSFSQEHLSNEDGVVYQGKRKFGLLEGDLYSGIVKASSFGSGTTIFDQFRMDFQTMHNNTVYRFLLWTSPYYEQDHTSLFAQTLSTFKFIE